MYNRNFYIVWHNENGLKVGKILEISVNIADFSCVIFGPKCADISRTKSVDIHRPKCITYSCK